MLFSQKISRCCLALVTFLIFACSTAIAQNKGPGGVGVVGSGSTLRGWWRGDNGITLTGGTVSTWADQSGNGNNLTQTTGSRRPSTATSAALNSQTIVRYGGSHFFNSSLSGPGTDNFTLFFVANGTSYQSLLRFQNDGSIFVVYPWENGGGRTFLVSTDGGTGGGINSGLVNSANNIGGARYRRNTSNGMQTFLNGTVNAQRNSVNVAVPTQPFYSGVYNPGTSEFPTADVGEMIVFYTALNEMQMAIVQNYLSAKFNVTLAGSDIYTMDNPANGNYDNDVAGIGRINSGNTHTDAQGTGILRVQNPTSLADNEYFLWGHDNGALTTTNTTDVPAGISGRFVRTWRVSETGEVGSIDIDIDVTGLTDFASLTPFDVIGKLRLLVDSDNDGVFNDQVPIMGATRVSGNIYRFSGVSAINNAYRFTFALATPQTFYSLGTGAWEDNTVWSYSADGSSGAVPAGVFPSRIDNVVINSGHTITVNNIADNGMAGVKPDDLGQANIGSFGSSNLAMFYQTGNIITRGTLDIVGIEAMIGGYTWVQNGGTLKGSSTIVITGNLQADSGSTLSTLDDLVLTGNSSSIINTASTSSDDLIIDHTDATLCGTGTTTLQNGAGSTITYANGATVSQVCTSFVVNCTGSGCSGFPVAGTTVVVLGGKGPAGVGTNSGDSQLKIWYRVDNGLSLTSTNVDTWANSAGIAALNITETAAQRPTYVTNAVNGFPEISFNGSNRLRTTSTLTAANFIVDRASTFVVNRADNTTQQSVVYATDPLDGNRFSNHIPWANVVYYDIGQCCGTDARMEVSGITNLNNYSIWTFDALPSSGKQLYRNGTLLQDRASTSSFNNHSSYRFNIGGNTGGAGGYAGDITEVIVFNTKINTAQRLLVDNYLSAKYAIALAANDLYVQDNAGNGNFDFDVAGLARASDGTYHKDSQGTGIVRMWAPSAIDNSEYLIWGHNGATLTTTTKAVGTDVDGTIIKERLTRIWSVTESGDVGTVNLSFETDQFTGAYVGSNLRLLIDRDGDGFQDNDVAPLSGTFSSNKIIFSGVNLQTGDRFTLGNTSSTSTLPIELLSFSAEPTNNDVIVQWKTASEINNDRFEILRSQDAERWNVITTVAGAGTTNEAHNYQAVDQRPLKGRSYYRLKQVDRDGQYSLSRAVSVEFVSDSYAVWPNPSTGVFNLSAADVYVEVWNTQGKKIISSYLDRSRTGIDISEYASGVYILKVYGEDSVKVYRIVKK